MAPHSPPSTQPHAPAPADQDAYEDVFAAFQESVNRSLNASHASLELGLPDDKLPDLPPQRHQEGNPQQDGERHSKTHPHPLPQTPADTTMFPSRPSISSTHNDGVESQPEGSRRASTAENQEDADSTPIPPPRTPVAQVRRPEEPPQPPARVIRPISQVSQPTSQVSRSSTVKEHRDSTSSNQSDSPALSDMFDLSSSATGTEGSVVGLPQGYHSTQSDEMQRQMQMQAQMQAQAHAQIMAQAQAQAQSRGGTPVNDYSGYSLVEEPMTVTGAMRQSQQHMSRASSAPSDLDITSGTQNPISVYSDHQSNVVGIPRAPGVSQLQAYGTSPVAPSPMQQGVQMGTYQTYYPVPVIPSQPVQQSFYAQPVYPIPAQQQPQPMRAEQSTHHYHVQSQQSHPSSPKSAGKPSTRQSSASKSARSHLSQSGTTRTPEASPEQEVKKGDDRDELLSVDTTPYNDAHTQQQSSPLSPRAQANLDRQQLQQAAAIMTQKPVQSNSLPRPEELVKSPSSVHSQEGMGTISRPDEDAPEVPSHSQSGKPSMERPLQPPPIPGPSHGESEGMLGALKRSLSRSKKSNSSMERRRHPRSAVVEAIDPETGALLRGRSLVRPERAKPRMGPTGLVHFVNSGGVAPDTPGYVINSAEGHRTIPRFDVLSKDRPSNQRPGNYAVPVTWVRKAWLAYCYMVTFWVPKPVLRLFGMKDARVQLAWREKMGLVMIIVFMCLILAFLTFFLNSLLCGVPPPRVKASSLTNGFVVINGVAYDVSTYNHPDARPNGSIDMQAVYSKDTFIERDLSFMFQTPRDCDVIWGDSAQEVLYPCTIGAEDPEDAVEISGNKEYCHQGGPELDAAFAQFRRQNKVSEIYYTWEEVANPRRHLTVFSGQILDLQRLDLLVEDRLNELLASTVIDIQPFVTKYKNRDATFFFNQDETMRKVGNCLASITTVGSLDVRSLGCIAADVIMYLMLVVIILVVMARFFMAMLYGLFLAPRISRKLTDKEKEVMREQRTRWQYLGYRAANQEASIFPSAGAGTTNHVDDVGTPAKVRPTSVLNPFSRNSKYSSKFLKSESATTKSLYLPDWKLNKANSVMAPLGSTPKDTSGTTLSAGNDPSEGDSSGRSTHSGPADPAACGTREGMYLRDDVMYVMLLVTCYSEGEEGIRTTLDSLSKTDYADDHKVMFVIADGLIKGEGNEKTTPELVVSMMETDPYFGDVPTPYSYVAIADGEKRHNMAQVYAGYYNNGGHRTPMVVVVKCGTEKEKNAKKPGNRGKRDSQLVLMSFLHKVMFDDRMTPLEFDLFQKLTYVMCGVTPDKFEAVMMVDADTIVMPDALERIVACLARDPQVMGLCGETTIGNKFGSYWTMMQVFEYYISHHLAKAFESVFGGVTCLPGCFCTYRIKSPKGPNGYWVPILASPDIVYEYSENVVDTLHKKNLLLLGEDRYLSTLMLRNFPKRKNMFIPGAVCKTLVPDSFFVLLSQRRRWINSTLHNLMELVLVRELCGIFCISMQFVVFMELVGTVVLPAAICFTIYLVVASFFLPEVPIIPLLLLAAILGLPAFVTLATIKRIHYVLWMLVYLSSLMIWNFVLPVYAFWHFDDFSWGETRKVVGESKDDHAKKEGEFDSSQIVMKRWQEWYKEQNRFLLESSYRQSFHTSHHFSRHDTR